MENVYKKLQLQHQIREKEVLNSELSTLKKNAKVYKQQQNSNVFFLANRDTVFSECKRTLDSLVQEYKEMESAAPSEDQEEEET
ncbi:ASNSD1 upstream open reading frame protein-like [Ylistrum balloti]|uniref:ASNSD1 upstream open reading frame protein-like n=1 Tax=Ylistrum balloti TaxID=509963 RepID=UPI002905BBB6|nr:ASNSD1 upstream open reading frame protein-like [Ylistrum balloti]